jgi:hypothetical protein
MTQAVNTSEMAPSLDDCGEDDKELSSNMLSPVMDCVRADALYLVTIHNNITGFIGLGPSPLSSSSVRQPMFIDLQDDIFRFVTVAAPPISTVKMLKSRSRHSQTSTPSRNQLSQMQCQAMNVLQLFPHSIHPFITLDKNIPKNYSILSHRWVRTCKV